MAWALLGSLAMSAGQSLLGNSAANKAATQQGITNNQREAAAWDNQSATNTAIGASNLQNVIRTGYKVGLLNVQRAQAKKAAFQQGIDLSRSALSASGSAVANAAASGSIGSSVSAVEHDIQMRVDEAGAQMGADYEVAELNFDTMLHDILTSGQDSIASPVTGMVESAPPVNTSSAAKALLGAAVTTAGQFYQAKMSLGTKKGP